MVVALLDAALLEAGVLDAAVLDAGVLEAGLLEAGVLEGARLDAGVDEAPPRVLISKALELCQTLSVVRYFTQNQ